MLFLSIVHHYLLWHYSRAFLEIFHVWLNFMWFIVHFFSIPELMRSWIAPWKRMVEGRGNTWNLEDLAAYVIIGLISRILGFMMRTVVITLGLAVLTVVVVGGFAFYVIWIGAPIVLIGLVGFGIMLLFA